MSTRRYYYFDPGISEMTSGLLPACQGGLFSFSNGVFDLSNLTTGAHTYYFGIDMNMNGAVDGESLYSDSVNVDIVQ